MFLSTYDPSSTANCPKCGVVSCYLIGGNLAFGERYLEFIHKDCGTKWRQFPFSDRKAMVIGEKNDVA